MDLQSFLDQLYNKYRHGFLDTDPVWFVHQYKNPADQEIVGLIAALLAFGNVAQIKRSVGKVLEAMGTSPHKNQKSPPNNVADPPQAEKIKNQNFLSEWRHRWLTAEDLKIFLSSISRVIKRYGSLKACFLKHYDPAAADLREAIVGFMEELAKTRDERNESEGLNFLLSTPKTGSAVKRINMFLRWMVRPRDGVDLGLWREINPSQLTIPLDTHIARIARLLGLTKRRSNDWKTAREITNALKKFDPKDPVKYDFALTRIGIVEGCKGVYIGKVCGRCLLKRFCSNVVR